MRIPQWIVNTGKRLFGIKPVGDGRTVEARGRGVGRGAEGSITGAGYRDSRGKWVNVRITAIGGNLEDVAQGLEEATNREQREKGGGSTRRGILGRKK